MKKIQLGDSLPNINVLLSNNETVNLQNYKGKTLILYFYPKDLTPGCTQESKEFKDAIDLITNKGAIVLGISRDSVSSHLKFIEKHDLPFDLISDPYEKLCILFDVIKEKNMYGKKYMGIERSTFVFNKQGCLTKEWRKVKVNGHVDEVTQAID